MMTTIYLIRHGTTDFNIDGRFQGTMQIPFNEQGLLQARILGEYLAPVHFDRVYTSPLIRAAQTANAICLPHALTAIPHVGLREIFGGDMEGHTGAENDAAFPEAMENFREHPPLFAAPNGESAYDVYARMADTMQEIVDENPHRTLAVVSHGFAIQTYLAYVMDHSFNNMRRNIVGNTSITILRYEEDTFPEILALDMQEHLPPEARFGLAPNFMNACQ